MPLAQRVRKTADIGRIASKHFVKLTAVSGAKSNSYSNSASNGGDANFKESPALHLKKSKNVFGSGYRDKTVAPRTPPLDMNHVTGQDRRVANPLNNVGEVEEMETQEGERTATVFHRPIAFRHP